MLSASNALNTAEFVSIYRPHNNTRWQARHPRWILKSLLHCIGNLGNTSHQNVSGEWMNNWTLNIYACSACAHIFVFVIICIMYTYVYCVTALECGEVFVFVYNVLCIRVASPAEATPPRVGGGRRSHSNQQPPNKQPGKKITQWRRNTTWNYLVFERCSLQKKKKIYIHLIHCLPRVAKSSSCARHHSSTTEQLEMSHIWYIWGGNVRWFSNVNAIVLLKTALPDYS